jgi:hypothetical protein
MSAVTLASAWSGTASTVPSTRSYFPSNIHTSSSPEGPFVGLDTTFNKLHCNNPAPFVLANGTIVVACGFTIYAADALEGPWRRVGSASPTPSTRMGVPGNWEDPYGNDSFICVAYFPALASAQATRRRAAPVLACTWASTPRSPFPARKCLGVASASVLQVPRCCKCLGVARASLLHVILHGNVSSAHGFIAEASIRSRLHPRLIGSIVCLHSGPQCSVSIFYLAR